MQYRNYDPNKDKDAAIRIWREIGWLHDGKEEAVAQILTEIKSMVADINGEPECLVSTTPGTIRYLDDDLPFVSVAAVATSHIVRKQGFAKRLTAQAVANAADEGALVVGLGMFEQGFYNQVGFGTGCYEHWIGFDPARLRVRAKHRIPRRFGLADVETIHASRVARMRGHGGVSLYEAGMTRVEMAEHDGFVLGYCDGPDGALTHHLRCVPQGKEIGPYFVPWLAYQNYEQFMELMALLKSLGDQVRLVRMREPQGIQLQDLLDKPFAEQRARWRGEMETYMRAAAPWQMRICDLPGCLADTRLPSGEVWFNLSLSDPIERCLDENGTWRGVGGDYVVTLGPSSGAERGVNPTLPTLAATVNAFTRMWLGVRPATGLAVTDDLAGPPELLHALDAVLRVPEPKPDWDF
jgi:predicted GNAT family acetyltransferase